MKKVYGGLVAAIISINAVSAIPAHASDVINIPASAAHPRLDVNNNCEIDLGIAFMAAGLSPVNCDLDFPITIPAGHIIKQISVISGAGNYSPSAFVSAWVQTQQVVPPYSNTNEFIKGWGVSAPGSTMQTDQLMTQWGKTYPDAFAVDATVMYHVVMRLWDGAYVAGLQVTYD